MLVDANDLNDGAVINADLCIVAATCQAIAVDTARNCAHSRGVRENVPGFTVGLNPGANRVVQAR